MPYTVAAYGAATCCPLMKHSTQVFVEIALIAPDPLRRPQAMDRNAVQQRSWGSMLLAPIFGAQRSWTRSWDSVLLAPILGLSAPGPDLGTQCSSPRSWISVLLAPILGLSAPRPGLSAPCPAAFVLLKPRFNFSTPLGLLVTCIAAFQQDGINNRAWPAATIVCHSA